MEEERFLSLQVALGGRTLMQPAPRHGMPLWCWANTPRRNPHLLQALRFIADFFKMHSPQTPRSWCCRPSENLVPCRRPSAFVEVQDSQRYQLLALSEPSRLDPKSPRSPSFSPQDAAAPGR